MVNNRKGRYRAALLIGLLLATLVLVPAVSAMRDPAAAYCRALGYQYTAVKAADGSMAGMCRLPDGRTVDAWKFLEGGVATDYSYCKKQGYALAVVSDRESCGMFLTESCSACVLADGSKTEVTKLMKLDLREKVCWNDRCCDPATDTTCSFGGPFEGPGAWPVIITAVVIVAAGIIVFILSMRKKGKEQGRKP